VITEKNYQSSKQNLQFAADLQKMN